MWGKAALTWGSRKQKCIALSTCEAEIIALSEAAKDMVYLRKFTAGLGETEPGPSTLSTDSQSARDVSYNPEHHDRMKHVARRHFFVRDMVESFELTVPHDEEGRIRPSDCPPLLRCSRAKIFGDGSLGAETAALRGGYVRPTGATEEETTSGEAPLNRGQMIFAPDELRRRIRRASLALVPPSCGRRLII